MLLLSKYKFYLSNKFQFPNRLYYDMNYICKGLAYQQLRNDEFPCCFKIPEGSNNLANVT